MSRYLVVAHQTAESEELLEQLLRLHGSDPEAEFVILVPPRWSPLLEERPEAERDARQRAEAARARLIDAGLTNVSTEVADAGVMAAIVSEVSKKPDYAAIVISTLPARISQWLKLDLVNQVKREFPRHRVIHVIASRLRRTQRHPA